MHGSTNVNSFHRVLNKWQHIHEIYHLETINCTVPIARLLTWRHNRKYWNLTHRFGKLNLSIFDFQNISLYILIYGGYTLFDHKKNEEILEEIKVEPVDENLRKYNLNWLRHVTRVNSSRMTKIMLSCRLHGRRRLGWPLKRLLQEAERVLSRPNWWQDDTFSYF
jgi:hypothetical protein